MLARDSFRIEHMKGNDSFLSSAMLMKQHSELIPAFNFVLPSCIIENTL